MEPGQVLVTLLYLWLLVAVGVYAWRAYRRVVHQETRHDRAARRAGGPDPAAPTAHGGSLVRQAIRDAVGDGATAGPARSGAPAGADDAPDRPPVDRLVAGITLPCGLVPVVTPDGIDPRRAVFTTAGPDAAEVGTALAAELGRLGFEVRPAGDTGLVARRDGATLQVRVHAGEAGPEASRPPAPGGVVVELST